MQLNHGRFRQNGGCGYVLRPDFMFQQDFDPSSKTSVVAIEPMILYITVIENNFCAFRNLCSIL